ncbi:hypothetical protein AAFF_G00168110 [Aldrovandia affinis]|uniref:Uncharacterized protein n=1 Tax=Aldrovandia affinis TaxID=143900 RepID=A0AAD7RMB6_9TELE|nr:hypothetical protein AAFF_G00168110 [Aldrovandia affinis]
MPNSERLPELLGEVVCLMCMELLSSLQGPEGMAIGHFHDQKAEVYPPVLELTQQFIRLSSCVNLSLTLICDQVTFADFYAIPTIEAEEVYQSERHRFFVAIPVVLVVLVVITLVVLYKRSHRMKTFWLMLLTRPMPE